MKLESVRELKLSLRVEAQATLAMTMADRPFGVAARSLKRVTKPPALALGIARRAGQKDFALAIRLQHRSLEKHPEVARLTRQALGEVDIRYVGRVAKRQVGAPVTRRVASTPAWNQVRVRPLQIGLSIGHHLITAGTLGAFAHEDGGSGKLVLSNNHVLANENEADQGDSILQPGHYDGGRDPDDRVASLLRFVRLEPHASNKVDGALASVDDGVECVVDDIRGLGTLTGVRASELEPGDAVAKLGRTTGLTRGRVTATELDGVVVSYEIGDLTFDDQIEIEGTGDDAFSSGGDSGSLIVDESRAGAALLFAGGDHGGTNGKGLTYANPIGAVLDALGVRLLS